MMRLWAVILAGGEGSRLHGVTTALTGEATPKQFCHLLGRTSLLEATTRRLAGIVDDRRTVLLLSSSHRRFYEDIGRSRPSSLLVEQPANQGTAVGMAFALGRIRQTDRHAVVGFFPSDHHYAHVSAFHQAASTAYRIAAQHPDRLVLIGATPHRAETDYGWIEPGPALHGPEIEDSVSAVSRFWEKPESLVARRLYQQGCLWNTFITVGTVGAFQGAFIAAQPALAAAVDAIASAASSSAEALVVEGIYQRVPRLCFSQHVLTQTPERCVVVPIGASEWTDVGHPERLAAIEGTAAMSA